MKTLDKLEVEEYIRLHAQAAPINKRLEELKKKLLPQLVEGAVSPVDLPFLLQNRPSQRPIADWKGYAFSLLLKLYRRSKDAEAKAQAELDATDASWEKKDVPALHVVQNLAAALQLGKTA